jgi:hypothetical protein
LARIDFHIETLVFRHFQIPSFHEGIKMRVAVLCVIVSVGLLSGCSPTKAGSDISNQPIPDSQIYIVGQAQVSSPTTSGKAPYTISCGLQYADTGKSNSDFNSAVVSVNGVVLKRVYRDGYFQNVGLPMQFSQGDSLEFVIKHQKTGTIKGVLYVPPSVMGVSVSPGLSMANLPNSDTLFSLSWDPVVATYSQVEAAGYNYWQTELVASYWLATLADTATVILTDNSGAACPYVYFRVQSFNAIPLQGFAPGSGLTVSGTYFKGNSNMPNVSSNVRQRAMAIMRRVPLR